MAKKAQALEKGIRKTENILISIGMVMLFMLMVLGASDVIGRYVFNRPILGTLEVGQILMAGVVLLGWAYTQAKRGHIRVELVTTHYPPRIRAILDFVSSLLALALFSLIAWQSVLTAILRWQRQELVHIIDIPLAPFMFFVSLGAFFLCLELIIQMIHLLPQMTRGD